MRKFGRGQQFVPESLTPVTDPPMAIELTGSSGQLVLEWEAPTYLADGSAVGSILNYNTYWGQTAGQQIYGGSYTGTASVASGTLTKTITGLAAGTWYASVSASNVAGESYPSNELTATVT